ncbi:MAG TPA: nitroreductase family protein [Acidimicrobiales bacterium]|jgi:nitroreductase|nr:nitroreductase family protein [Acidimicrobiales bacterium]
MELDEAIRRRRMCRDFAPTAVADEVVDRLLDRARRAPSAGHSQGWAYLVLTSPEERSMFWAAIADPAWVADPSPPGLVRAPVIIVPLCSPSVYRARYAEADKAAFEWTVPYWLVDTSFATMLLLLGAEAEGLGALFFRLHRPPTDLRAAFGVPDGWEPIGAVALGYRGPNDAGDRSGSAARGRRPFTEIVHRGGW